jgi:hypothetical protein
MYDENNRQVRGFVTKTIPSLFAFSSDLKSDRKNELERYKKLDIHWNTDPSILNLCVVGKGYWWWSQEKNEWKFTPPTKEYDEIIDFLTIMMNTIPRQITTRGQPPFGAYLGNPKWA